MIKKCKIIDILKDKKLLLTWMGVVLQFVLLDVATSLSPYVDSEQGSDAMGAIKEGINNNLIINGSGIIVQFILSYLILKNFSDSIKTVVNSIKITITIFIMFAIIILFINTSL